MSKDQMIGPGILIEHPLWGKGKIVEQRGPYLFVYFPSLADSPDGPLRKIQAVSAFVRVADEQSDPVLDHVKVGPAGKAKSGARPRIKPVATPPLHTLDQAIAWFRVEYPGLFKDSKLEDEELGYKRAAHRRWVEVFGQSRGQRLIEENRLEEIAAGLNDVHRRTNIPSRFEIMAANDGYKSSEAASGVLRGILAFLDHPDGSTFGALVRAISSLPAKKDGSRVLTWPNATILPFLADPARFMVVKPESTQRMARRMNFDIMYSSDVTWHCYERILRLSEMLLDRLGPLGAKDYVDVQSFMWVTQDLH